MTPSDYSNGSSVEHDAMQADFADALRSVGNPELEIKWIGQDVVIQRKNIMTEFMLATDKLGILGFLDIVEIWKAKPETQGSYVGYRAYELKPHIMSCGGLIRQLYAQERALSRWLVARKLPSVETYVVPVVMSDDPLLGLFRRLWPGEVCLWDPENKVIL